MRSQDVCLVGNTVLRKKNVADENDVDWCGRELELHCRGTPSANTHMNGILEFRSVLYRASYGLQLPSVGNFRE